MTITEVSAGTFEPENFQARIEAGEIFILRAMPEIPELLALISKLSARYFDDITAEDIRPTILGRVLPDDRRIAAIARAMRRARNEYLGTTLFLPFIERLKLGPPVQVEAGMSRVRTTPEIFDRVKSRTDLIPPTETAPAAAPDLAPPVFALKNAPPHRDIHRPHYTTQMNLWFCLHDTGPDEALVLFPDAFKNPVRPEANADAGPESWGLGKSLQPDLRFGDALLFSSEHYHASPIHNEGRIRYSWDIRLVAGCWDDNQHYRNNFIPMDALWPLNGLRSFDGMIATADFAADFPDLAPQEGTDRCESQRLCLAWLEKAVKRADFQHAADMADLLLKSSPADQIAYEAARILLAVQPDKAKPFLLNIAHKSASFYWTLRAGELAAKQSFPELARQCLERCEDLCKTTTVSTAHNPIDYMVHGGRHVAQTYPAQAAERAAGILASL